jgi:hypothetical protein
MKNLPQLVGRLLTGAEEKEFTKWAKDNFKPDEMEINETWHPITRAACWEMMAEHYGENIGLSTPRSCKRLYQDLLEKISDFELKTQTNEDMVLWMYLQAIVAKQENKLLKHP